MMMSLGFFIFELSTVPYQQLQRVRKQKYASNSRVSKRNSYQFMGPGEETITLTGTLFPSFTGGILSLNMLDNMAKTGKSYNLITGDGEILGYYKLDQIQETQKIFCENGQARQIEFTVNLTRTDDNEDFASNSKLGELIGLNEIDYTASI